MESVFSQQTSNSSFFWKLALVLHFLLKNNQANNLSHSWHKTEATGWVFKAVLFGRSTQLTTVAPMFQPSNIIQCKCNIANYFLSFPIETTPPKRRYKKLHLLILVSVHCYNCLSSSATNVFPQIIWEVNPVLFHRYLHWILKRYQLKCFYFVVLLFLFVFFFFLARNNYGIKVFRVFGLFGK